MTSGFGLHLNELDRLANQELPLLAEMMAEPIPALAAFHDFGPTHNCPEAGAVTRAHSAHLDLISSRQRQVCDAIDETAGTLREIIALYRRADGQG
ncbi:hypothetical protein [Actinokineospora sp. UTMC 2448]|uniref:hypothetical protein n=1 Tax=Actinokineospora sp. UTMC 2448 TaxID=2268449 RepID=UPI0021648077|nr:hypothetical protein [Actinokineospora sp. UTMC 2448]UVS80141.1 hypothetical protein Actkin_03891 [Actinokineospora sp. UTMC 2448]